MNTEPEFCARCLQLDEECKCYALADVVEFSYDCPESVRTLRTFTDKDEAVAFMLRHYDTQIGTYDNCTDPECACRADMCECENCAEGWRATEWKTFAVEVW
jgi:hypothetical protein